MIRFKLGDIVEYKTSGSNLNGLYFMVGYHYTVEENSYHLGIRSIGGYWTDLVYANGLSPYWADNFVVVPNAKPLLKGSQAVIKVNGQEIGFFSPSQFDMSKAFPIGECEHDMATYTGFIETYKYCKKCTYKESKP
jgi:hypothetical protein